MEKPFDTSSEASIRRWGYALKKVMLGLVAQSKERHLEDAVERGSVAALT